MISEGFKKKSEDWKVFFDTHGLVWGFFSEFRISFKSTNSEGGKNKKEFNRFLFKKGNFNDKKRLGKFSNSFFDSWKKEKKRKFSR
mmetsp:Transcript_33810/g.67649  ORF Transcript_33810/g.67649 Transcript_33810/m.67649 type:complete len:86 (+) Transcript_33810:165-422(+)